MPLPPALDEKIRNRFDELIFEANELVPKMQAHDDEVREKSSVILVTPRYGHIPEFRAIVVNALSLIEVLFGGSK